jgi:hypothetical protein
LTDFAVQAGDVLRASIIVKNTGGSRIDDVTARIILDAPSVKEKSILNWMKLEDENNGKISGEQRSETLRRGEIVWNAGKINSLQRILPGDSVLIDFSLPIKTSKDIDLSEFTNYLIDAVAEVQYNQGTEHKVLSSNQIKITLNSDTAMSVQDDVNDLDGGKKKHLVSWVLNNSFHEIKNIEIETDVYGDITWSESDKNVPAGEVKFEEEGQKVKWKIDSMPISVDVLALQFGIILNKENPSQTNLTSKVRFKAQDAVTGEDMVIVGDEILLNRSNN